MADSVLTPRSAASAVSVEKQHYFDRYWVTRDFLRTDRRTMERAQLIWSRLTRRRGRALDVGCGRGLFAAFLAEQGLIVDAADVSPQAVEITAQRGGIQAFLLDLESQSPLGSYDLVFCLEVLQQVRDPEAGLLRLARAVADDGELVISVPNEFHLLRRLHIAAGQIDFGGPDDSHIKLFTPARGAELLERCGLEIRTRVHTAIIPPEPEPLGRLGRALAWAWPAGLALSTIFFARKTRP